MLFDEKKIKLWSQLGQRASFGLACLELQEYFPNLIILTSDVSTSAGLDRFRKQFKEKYLEVGISEQNLLGVAAGLASEGFDVITTTFSPFQILRCCEQIKVNLGYMKQKVCMVGLASGVVLGTLGYTHCSIEDIGVLRSIPNITIISPADVREMLKALEASLKHHQSVYLRLSGSTNNKIVYKKNYNFKIGKSVRLSKGKDITIFCTGSMVSVSQDVLEVLNSNNISAELINIHTIKPIDKTQIVNSANNSKIFFSVEEHSVIGGLGTAISEVCSELDNCPKLIKLGLEDLYNISGDYSYILEKNQLTCQLISKRIIEQFKKNKK
jgi:transketolase